MISRLGVSPGCESLTTSEPGLTPANAQTANRQPLREDVARLAKPCRTGYGSESRATKSHRLSDSSVGLFSDHLTLFQGRFA